MAWFFKNTPEQLLIMAVTEGDHLGVERALREGAEPNTCMPFSFHEDWGGHHKRVPVLSVAAHMGYIDIANALLEAKVNIEYRGDCDRTPLINAVAGGFTNMVERLLNHGADINARTTNCGELPIHTAATGAYIKIMEILRDHGNSLNMVSNNGRTPLHCSVYSGKENVLKWIVGQGVDVGAVDYNGNTAADEAESRGHMAMTAWLRSCDPGAARTQQKKRKINIVAAMAQLRIQEPNTIDQDLPTEKLNSKVVVLNYKRFSEPFLSKRPGANKDSSNLSQVFTNLGYDVDIHESLTASATEDVLNDLQNNSSIESLILIILSHGLNKSCFYTREGDIMDLDKIRMKFTDTACPQLKGRAKVILSNFCRGQEVELHTDTSVPLEVPHNMVTIHASVDNIKVLRHPRNGTLFISSLCRILEKDQDLQEMYNKLYEQMKEDGGTTPMMEVFAPFPKFSF